MALTDEFARVQGGITLMRQYAWRRFGEETDAGSAQVARWRAFLNQLLNAMTQIETFRTNFIDIN